MSTPHKQHEKACKVAGIEGLTLHGLRRSFRSLTEWLEIPAGVVAQMLVAIEHDVRVRQRYREQHRRGQAAQPAHWPMTFDCSRRDTKSGLG